MDLSWDGSNPSWLGLPVAVSVGLWTSAECFHERGPAVGPAACLMSGPGKRKGAFETSAVICTWVRNLQVKSSQSTDSSRYLVFSPKLTLPFQIQRPVCLPRLGRAHYWLTLSLFATGSWSCRWAGVSSLSMPGLFVATPISLGGPGRVCLLCPPCHLAAASGHSRSPAPPRARQCSCGTELLC